MSNINVIVAAGGQSQRYGVENKLFEQCGSSCVLVEAVKPFLSVSGVTKLIIAIDPSYSDELLNALSTHGFGEDNRITLTVGGNSRTETVKRGLKEIDDECDIVLIHDGARPYVTNQLIESVAAGAKECGAALPLLPLTDALCNIENGVRPENRSDFRLVQTPAGFAKNRVLTAYSACDKDFFDDISVVQTYAPGEVRIIEGDVRNIKITTKEDLKKPAVGCGYDIHRLTKGCGVKLCGEFIGCPYSFVAHSDGDVPLHALMDAILSACGERDIGYYFPVDDPAYDGADSMELLNEVVKIARKRGKSVSNASLSIIAEQPYLAPHIEKMRLNVAKSLSIPLQSVGITATTNEGVGEIGQHKAVACYAAVILI